MALADTALAQSLVKACEDYAAGSTDADVDVVYIENDICAHLDIPLDQTELGLTREAVETIEKFVSDTLGRKWSYEDAGLLGAEGTR